jgi:hypothetical protein
MLNSKSEDTRLSREVESAFRGRDSTFRGLEGAFYRPADHYTLYCKVETIRVFKSARSGDSVLPGSLKCS